MEAAATYKEILYFVRKIQRIKFEKIMDLNGFIDFSLLKKKTGNIY